ncbi:uncharacterized protein LOC133839541 [Drosophila sulfurigaster albostrigata]|uniref:Uncharacterized protein LOC117574650 n=1 Tax=Drosophila albomicans TaxID=7291 RepID=A0A6P8XSV9_DROAB|nr:uncharacterized protein LOC117574650 [Drosophila albomicans]XP_062127126.1 uncharacterized protein LOC133839541 [Drosophila sulfurigaster albostrigata]
MKIVIFVCLLPLSLGARWHISNCPSECPDTEDIVWAMGQYCNVFRNKCFFDGVNCFRWSIFMRPMRIVDKVECQKHCDSDCSKKGPPVVEYYKTEVKHFRNICESILHTCRTGQIFE